MQSNKPLMPVLCLMGPTASGKTPLAIEIVKQFPCDIISVDSALVYRGMDIGTAKPTQDILHIAPHRLIDIVDPKDAYSAGRFRKDALHEIDDIFAQGKIPLLVGGTMLYYRALIHGLAHLPEADMALRQRLQARAEVEGWETLHKELASIDAIAAERIQPRDSQRIQRALEVYLLTSKPMSAWQNETERTLPPYDFHYLALIPNDRERLHNRIAERFKQMLHDGFIEEVKKLHERSDLTADLPSIRSVGYRQAWAHLDGQLSYADMQEQAIIATRQLAKRQMTWLRSWPTLTTLDSESSTVTSDALKWIERITD